MVFGEIDFEVNTADYIEWAELTKSRFVRMVETMINVARIIELQTIPLVPLDTSALEQSYTYQYVRGSDAIVMAIGFDAVDEKSGFHYAHYQHHYNLHHPKRGVQGYLVKGINRSENRWLELIESDYMSLFLGGNVMGGGIGKNNSMANWEYRTVYRGFEW